MQTLTNLEQEYFLNHSLNFFLISLGMIAWIRNDSVMTVIQQALSYYIIIPIDWLLGGLQ